MIDIHSHILPGIDDGSKNIEMSLKILKGLAEQGITDVICTPHYIAETSQVSPRAKNEELLKNLQQQAKKRDIRIKLYLGNEIYIDRDIAKLIRYKKASPLAKSKYLLVELPMSGKFEQYEDILLNLQQSGWTVILAHPERYLSFQKHYGKIVKLHKQGVLLQCNLGSFIGQYGRRAKKTAKKIAKDKLLFCVGTDIHHTRNFNEIAKAQKKLGKYYEYYELDAVLVQNPHKIVQ
jgi:protein-tyrosine phosphatase